MMGCPSFTTKAESGDATRGQGVSDMRFHPHPHFLGMLQEVPRNTEFLDIIGH